MSRHTEHDTREHLLATGERLCMHRGFTGMGLSELLKPLKYLRDRFITIFVPKRRSALPCWSGTTPATISAAAHFASGEGDYRDRVLNYYQETLTQFCQQGIISGCLTVKLSAEVCDLSEDMRTAMDKGPAA